MASFGSQLVYLGSLPLETQAKLYADGPDVVFAGALFPVQQATPTERGFLLNGRWKFASGCVAADIVCVGIPGDDSTSGKPRGAVVRPERLEIVRDWDVVGMRGTGSFDLVAEDVEVEREWTFIRGGEPVIDEPLYRYPAITYAAQSLSVVSAGVARAALDHAEEAGGGRASITGAPKLADRAYYRAGIAEAEAVLRSARAYFYEAADEAWQTLAAGGLVSDEQNAHMRLSAAHLARTASEVVHKVVSLSGTAAIHRDHPLQALLGDAVVPQEHAFLSPAMYDAAGAVFMGRPPTVPAFR
ncbi:acyl-CoA dehydrogenase family protein [Nonomuraea sp. SYSU D8015]|uniref:acyl-CoA dehydrogenase family protein n=1 Tax=Nonomuraea sp. SYSU D8015 TaxID=2593644 RepID=UPI001CB742F8|nr:acyl-CoA dehydrogenase family protein [Nonomuraea sp. SYSU D8015]